MFVEMVSFPTKLFHASLCQREYVGAAPICQDDSWGIPLSCGCQISLASLFSPELPDSSIDNQRSILFHLAFHFIMNTEF